MITKNGSLIMGRVRIGSSTIPSNTLVNYTGTVYSEGVYGSANMNSPNKNNTSNNPGDNYVVMNLGVGDTAPTVNDYSVAQSLIDGVDVNTLIVCTAAMMSFGSTGNPVYTYAFTNNAADAITVKEIGLSITLSGGSQGKYLLAREVLSSPRTVAPGETVTFSYEIAFN